MSRLKTNPFTFDGFITVVRRNLVSALLSLLICCCVSLIVFFYVPAQYLSTFVAGIPSTYFKNPVINDVLPEITEAVELEGERRALVRRALSDDFLDALGEKFGLFSHPLNTPEHLTERKKLLRSIQYQIEGATSFRISVIAPSPSSAHGLALEVLDKLRYTIIEERFASFQRVRDALSLELASLEKRSPSSHQVGLESLRDSLAQANAVIQELRKKYTDSHPELYQMQQRAQELREQISRKSSSGLEQGHKRDQSEGGSTSGRLHEELLRKLSFLNVALNIERSKDATQFLAVVDEPMLPRTPRYPLFVDFLRYGFAVGLIVALLQTIYFEYHRSQFYDPDEIAEALGVPFFGALPHVEARELQYLIDHAVKVQERRLLPHL